MILQSVLNTLSDWKLEPKQTTDIATAIVRYYVGLGPYDKIRTSCNIGLVGVFDAIRFLKTQIFDYRPYCTSHLWRALAEITRMSKVKCDNCHQSSFGCTKAKPRLSCFQPDFHAVAERWGIVLEDLELAFHSISEEERHNLWETETPTDFHREIGHKVLMEEQDFVWRRVQSRLKFIAHSQKFDLEDLVQDINLRCLAELSAFDQNRDETFLRRIVRNITNQYSEDLRKHYSMPCRARIVAVADGYEAVVRTIDTENGHMNLPPVEPDSQPEDFDLIEKLAMSDPSTHDWVLCVLRLGNTYANFSDWLERQYEIHADELTIPQLGEYACSWLGLSRESLRNLSDWILYHTHISVDGIPVWEDENNMQLVATNWDTGWDDQQEDDHFVS